MDYITLATFLFNIKLTGKRKKKENDNQKQHENIGGLGGHFLPAHLLFVNFQLSTAAAGEQREKLIVDPSILEKF